MGSLDNGLLVLSGKLNEGVSFGELDEALWLELDRLREKEIEIKELNKLLNKVRTSKEFEEQGMLNRAMALCYFELLGDASLINSESDKYVSITPKKLRSVAQQVIRKENCSLLKIKATL